MIKFPHVSGDPPAVQKVHGEAEHNGNDDN